MDKLIQKIVALGVPGIILLVAVNVSGLAGAAAITSALALFGGPFGMIGGIGAMGLAVLIMDGISKYGFEKIFEEVVQDLIRKGESKDSIKRKIEGYPISKDLKTKLNTLL